MTDEIRPEHEAPHDELEPLKALLATYGRQVVIVACVVVIAFAAITYYRASGRRKTRQAAQLLASASTFEDMEALLERYGSSPSAPLALLKLAKLYYVSGSYDMARGKYEEFENRYKAHEMVSVATLGKIHAIEAMGQANEAFDAFTSFAEEHPDHFLAPQAALGRARCMEQLRRLDEAKALYEDFIAANPDSGWRPRAEELLESLEKDIKAAAQPPVIPEVQETAGATEAEGNVEPPAVVETAAPVSPEPPAAEPVQPEATQ